MLDFTFTLLHPEDGNFNMRIETYTKNFNVLYQTYTIGAWGTGNHGMERGKERERKGGSAELGAIGIGRERTWREEGAVWTRLAPGEDPVH